MRKRIAGGVLVTVAAAVVFQAPQFLNVYTEHNAAIQQAFQPFAKEAAIRNDELVRVET